VKQLLAMKVMEFKGDDEIAGTPSQAAEPTLYDDGTAEIRIDVTGNRTVYVRFSIAELVRLRVEAAEVEEAPEK
jgi:hypothetical protein